MRGFSDRQPKGEAKPPRLLSRPAAPRAVLAEPGVALKDGHRIQPAVLRERLARDHARYRAAAVAT